MNLYLALKVLHILSATILFGTGLGTAFFMWMALRSKNIEAIRVTARHVVMADWYFTTPAIIIQPLTGLALMHLLGWPFDSLWFALVIGLYLLAGACWVPVVVIQLRLWNLAEMVTRYEDLPQRFQNLSAWWFALGWPAFGALLFVFWLMVAKPGI